MIYDPAFRSRQLRERIIQSISDEERKEYDRGAVSSEAFSVTEDSDEDSLSVTVWTPPIDAANIGKNLPIILALLELPNTPNVEAQTRFGLNLIETSVEIDSDNSIAITFAFDWDFSLSDEYRKRLSSKPVGLIREAGGSLSDHSSTA